jgi:glutathione S-transferase
VDIFGGDTLTEAFGRANPARCTPVLEIAPGQYLPESGAILGYLAAGSPLLPTDPLVRAQVVRWLLYEQTEVVPGVGGLRFRLQTGRLAPDDPEARRRRQAGEEVLGLLDGHLASRDFFVGKGYTIADIAVYGYVHRAHEAGFDLGRWPAVQAWIPRVTAQPLYMNDVEPYPANARPGAGRSIYG